MPKSSRTVPAFSIVAAFRRAGRALKSHGWIPLLLSTSATLVVLGAFMGSITAYLWRAQAGTNGAQGVDMPVWLPYTAFVGWIAIVAVGQTLAAQVIHQATVGEKARFSAAFRSLWRDVPLVIVLLLGQWLLVTVGLGLILVPGLICAVLFSMVVPARVASGGGPVKVFRDSFDTARGNGWKLAAFLLIANLIGVAFVFTGNAAGEAFSKMTQAMMKAQGAPGPLAIIVLVCAMVSFVVFVGCIPFVFGLFPAAAYAELKAAHDDNVVASAFD